MGEKIKRGQGEGKAYWKEQLVISKLTGRKKGKKKRCGCICGQ